LAEKVRADFVVRLGEGGLLGLDLKLGGKAFPLTMEAERAADVGRALLAGATVSRVSGDGEPGAVVQNCVFPVEEWWTGKSVADGAPMLVVSIAGGLQLAFRFGADGAQECGAALARTGAAVASET
jgi:hypothetical protein